jgi:hypothetical protein
LLLPSVKYAAGKAEIRAHFEQIEASERWGSVLSAEMLVAAVYCFVSDPLAGCKRRIRAVNASRSKNYDWRLIFFW